MILPITALPLTRLARRSLSKLFYYLLVHSSQHLPITEEFVHMASKHVALHGFIHANTRLAFFPGSLQAYIIIRWVCRASVQCSRYP
jgi:hypothetical protein